MDAIRGAWHTWDANCAGAVRGGLATLGLTELLHEPSSVSAHFPFVRSPTPLVTAILAYLAVVAYGRLIRRPQPPGSKESAAWRMAVQGHNLGLVALSSYMFLRIIYEARKNGYSLWGPAFNVKEVGMARVIYVFYMSKWWEFLDTVRAAAEQHCLQRCRRTCAMQSTPNVLHVPAFHAVLRSFLKDLLVLSVANSKLVRGTAQIVRAMLHPRELICSGSAASAFFKRNKTVEYLRSYLVRVAGDHGGERQRTAGHISACLPPPLHFGHLVRNPINWPPLHRCSKGSTAFGVCGGTANSCLSCAASRAGAGCPRLIIAAAAVGGRSRTLRQAATVRSC